MQNKPLSAALDAALEFSPHDTLDASIMLQPSTDYQKTLQALTLSELLSLKIPPREMLLSPIIPTQGLVMLYAARGIGKTYVSLSIALSVASGGNTLGDRWKSDKPHKVLFVDGEMPATVLQQRLAAMVASSDKELPDSDYLKIITPDQQEFGIGDLATVEGQEAIEQHLDGVELLILDNLSSLCRRGKENEAESWVPVQEWMLSLRKRGKFNYPDHSLRRPRFLLFQLGKA